MEKFDLTGMRPRGRANNYADSEDVILEALLQRYANVDDEIASIQAKITAAIQRVQSAQNTANRFNPVNDDGVGVDVDIDLTGSLDDLTLVKNLLTAWQSLASYMNSELVPKKNIQISQINYLAGQCTDLNDRLTRVVNEIKRQGKW